MTFLDGISDGSHASVLPVTSTEGGGRRDERGSHTQWYERPEARAVQVARDVGGVYRLSRQDGVTQREIARRTGQSQSEVPAILRGRQVRDVTVLERIVDGSGVPRAFMRLSGGADVGDGAYLGKDAPEEVEDMHRRMLLATPSPASCWLPSTSELGSLVVCRWPTVSSPL